MKKQRYQFDLIAQRFMVNRWETETGKQVYAEIQRGIKASEDIRPLLEHYVLDHPLNIDPYEYPVYPRDAMQPGAFWVLAPEDMRGISFYQEDFYATRSLSKVQLSLASFYKCNLRSAHLSMTRLSFAKFEGCDLRNAVFAHSEGIGTEFVGSELCKTCFLGTDFKDMDCSGADFRDAYFEDARFGHLRVDYLTRFDLTLAKKWKNRSLPPRQLPDLYRALRRAYQRADLWHVGDRYLFKERTANRKYIKRPLIIRQRSIRNALVWLMDLAWGLISGYGTRPKRLIASGMSISVIYAVIYHLLGGPVGREGVAPTFASALYFSFTTFATLGYGDISYGPDHPWLRLLSTSEAWVGAIMIALFVAVMARKILR